MKYETDLRRGMEPLKKGNGTLGLKNNIFQCY